MRPSCNVAGTAGPPRPKVWSFRGGDEDEKERKDLAKFLLSCFLPTSYNRGLSGRRTSRRRRREEEGEVCIDGRTVQGGAFMKLNFTVRWERCQKVRRPYDRLRRITGQMS